MSDVQEITRYFINNVIGQADQRFWKRTAAQVKSLNKNYSKDQIIQVIDYLVYEKNVNLYSFGYVSAAINDVLETLNCRNLANQEKEKMEKHHIQGREVKKDDKSGERNRGKAEQLGLQSRIREKYSFDLFEGE